MELKPYTTQRIQDLHEDFRPLVEEMLKIAHTNGLNAQVSSGFRSSEQQQALYDQGRTRRGPIVTNAKPGESAHNWRVAVDIFFLTAEGKASFDERLYKRLWKLCVGAGLDKKGLSWSGNWTGKLKETAHFEISDWKRYKK